jgi:hypothetical protein
VLPRCVLRLLRTRNEREQTRRGKERKTMNPLILDKTTLVSFLIAVVVCFGVLREGSNNQ